MKRRLEIIFGIMVVVLMTILIYQNSSDHEPEDWPSRDKMESNLTRKGYDIQVMDSIIINGKTYEGERITGTKGDNYVEAFWYEDESAVDSLDQYLDDTYDGGSYHRLNNTLYFGTKTALKNAGLGLRTD